MELWPCSGLAHQMVTGLYQRKGPSSLSHVDEVFDLRLLSICMLHTEPVKPIEKEALA